MKKIINLTNKLLLAPLGLYCISCGSCGSEKGTVHGAMSFAELGFVNSDYTPEGVLKAGAPPGQLYDLSTDPSQATNLYEKYPEKVAELRTLLEKIRKEPRSRP